MGDVGEMMKLAAPCHQISACHNRETEKREKIDEVDDEVDDVDDVVAVSSWKSC